MPNAREARDLYLCRFTAEIEDQKETDHIFTCKGARLVVTSHPAFRLSVIRWSVTSSQLLEPTDQGVAPFLFALGPDTQRRLEESRAVFRTACVPARTSGSTRYSVCPSVFGAVVSLRYVLPQESGGDEETRTPDPLLAKEMLFQLSYVPLSLRQVNFCLRRPLGPAARFGSATALAVSAPRLADGGRFWTRTRDLCLIRAVL
jgi:hypothetical protein